MNKPNTDTEIVAGQVLEVCRETVIKEIIVRMMSRCGPLDSWKKNEKPDISNMIIELSLLLDEIFTMNDAIEVAKINGIPL